MAEKQTIAPQPHKAVSGKASPQPGTPFFEAAPDLLIQRQEAAPAASGPPATPPSDSPPPAAPPFLPGGNNSGFQLPQPDWFEMSRPFFNRGVPWLRMDENSGIIQQWNYNYLFFRQLGFNNERAGWLSNQTTPLAIDSQLSQQYPTGWERMDRELNTSSRILAPTLLRFKTEVNRPGDAAEQEADTVAEKIVQGQPLHNGNGNAFTPAASAVQCSGNEEQPAPPPNLQSMLASAGQPLPTPLRQNMEQQFGHDFSQVTIHTNNEAAGIAQHLKARAFATGEHIAFGKNQYNPDTPEGRRLLAHELTHVLQQRIAGPGIQRKGIIMEGGEITVTSFLGTSAKTSENLKRAKSIVENLDCILVVTGNQLVVYNAADDKVIGNYSINPVYLPFFYYIGLPDGKFGIAALQNFSEEEGGKTVEKNRYVVYGKTNQPATDADKATIAAMDEQLTIHKWFVNKKDSEDYYKKTDGKIIVLVITPVGEAAGGSGSESENPPMLPWMPSYQEAIRKLMAERRAAEPTSTDLPEKFAFYYSKVMVRWRAFAEQLTQDPKKPLRVYLDVTEKDDKNAKLQQIRDKIRIKQLSDPEAVANPNATPMDPDMEWSYRLKLELDQLIKAERAKYPTAADLPDKTSIITQEDQPKTPYLKLSMYVTENNAEGKTVSTLKSGVLAAPLTPDTKPADLFIVVRKAALAIRGVDIKPTSDESKSHEHKLAAFPANIESLNIRDDYKSVTGGELEMLMLLNMSAIEGENLLHLTTIAYKGIYFTWDVYRISDAVPDAELSAMPTDWKARRPALQAWFKNSGQLRNIYPVFKDLNLEKTRADLQKEYKDSYVGEYRRAGMTYGVNTKMDRDATVKMPEIPDDYVVFCRAQVQPSETVYRLPSEAFFTLRVEDGYDLAAQVRDERTNQIEGLKKQIEEETDDKQKAALQEKLKALENQEKETLTQRTHNQISDQKKLRALAIKLKNYYAQSLSQKKPITTLLAADEDSKSLLDLWLMLETNDFTKKPVEKLEKMIGDIDKGMKGLQDINERVSQFSDELKGYTLLPAPAVGLVSKVTGQIYPLLLTLGYKTETKGDSTITKVVLVDVTSHETQESYSGNSSSGLADAVHKAFANFGEECKYGEGFIAYRVPDTNAIGRVASKPGPWQQVKTILGYVAAAAGLIALAIGTVATGGTALAAAAFWLGVGASVVGAGLAIENIYDRADNHRLHADVELAMDLLNIAGPFLQGASAMARISKINALKGVMEVTEAAGTTEKAVDTVGALSKLQKAVMLEKTLVVLQKGEAITNLGLIGYKTHKDLEAVARAYEGDPKMRSAMEYEIMKNAIISGTFALVALRNEFKIKDADQLEMMVNSALKEKAYIDHMIKSGYMDAQGNWIDPRIKAIIDGGGTSTNEGNTPPKSTDTGGKTGEQLELPGMGGKQPAPKEKDKIIPADKPPLPKPVDTPQAKPKTEEQQPAKQEDSGQKANTTDDINPPSKAEGDSTTVKRKGEVFPKELAVGQSHTFTDGATATKVDELTIKIESTVKGSSERKDFESLMAGVGELGLHGWVRAHSQGQGTGHENPYGILYAPMKVNEFYQNKGIEDHLRLMFNDIIPPEFEIKLTTVTKAHPPEAGKPNNRLASIEYKVEISKPGVEGRMLAYEASIKVENSINDPKVSIDATPYGIKAFIDLSPDATPGEKLTSKNMGTVNPQAQKMLRTLDEVIANLKLKEKQEAKLDAKKRTAQPLRKTLEDHRKSMLENPTAATVKNAQEGLDSTFLIYPKDALVSADAKALIKTIKPMSFGKGNLKPLQKASLEALILKAGDWKALIATLKAEKRTDLLTGVEKYRTELVNQVKTKFKADTLPGASTNPESDVDLSTKGIDAGSNLLKAEAELEGMLGAGWEKALRLNFYAEADRLSMFKQVEGLQNADQAKTFNQKMTDQSADFALAKMLKHAEGNPAREAQVKELIQEVAPGRETGIHSLAKNYSGVAAKRKAELHLEIDGLVKQYQQLNAADPKRVELAQAISLKQLEINFYTQEAYLSSAAVKVASTKMADKPGAGLTPQERIQSVLSNVEMMEHFIHESGGTLSATQEYELYKYMFRVSESMYNPQTDLFYDRLTFTLYKINRDGPSAMTPGQALTLYDDFMKYVTKYLAANKGLISQ